MTNLTGEQKQKFFTRGKEEEEEAAVEVAPDNIVMKSKDSLLRFITKLRRILEQNCFSICSFESASLKLERECSNYTSLIENLDPPQPKELQRHKLAKRMFDTMVDAIRPLKYYKLMGREYLL